MSIVVSVAPRTRVPRHQRIIVGSPSSVWFILAQLAPMVLISAAFLARGEVLTDTLWGGVPIITHLAATSVIMPLAAQASSGAVYSAISGLPPRAFGAIAARCVRAAPRSIAIGAPFAALLALVLAVALGLNAEGTAALLAYVGVNFIFAAAITFAYVVRSTPIIVASWTAFAVGLAVGPQFWWLPATLAAVVCIASVVTVASAQRTSPVVLPPVSQAIRHSVRGVLDALPLWSIPFLILVTNPADTAMGTLFLCVLPALILYQVYFSLIARPMWLELHLFRTALERTTVTEATSIGGPLRRLARSGWIVLLLGVIAGMSFAVIMAGLDDAFAIALPLAAASIAGTAMIAESTRLTAVTGGWATSAAGLLPPLAYLSVWSIAGEEAGLWAFALTCTITVAALAATNARLWRDLRYQLFWRRAASA
ncbi:MAG: hypothetical protein ABWY03_08670 [Microbacterium sp.]